MRSYTYDPDGNATSTGSGATTDLKYVGGHQLAGLTHFGARYYDSATTRWTQQDPMNQFASLVEANRYAYVGCNPVNNVDLTGFGLTDLVKKGANYVSDNIDGLTEKVGGTLVEKLYCTGAIVTLAAAVGAALGGLLCGALHVARNPRYPT